MALAQSEADAAAIVLAAVNLKVSYWLNSDQAHLIQDEVAVGCCLSKQTREVSHAGNGCRCSRPA